ncbi:biliverdin-producing heme oxygenase [Corallococcus carmarthensis]|uniref:Heme oxygenase n=1 Tax=Corallococcus carmarthensis TaxID=2316728 RepID=A0A3A8KCB1_9BACT|nr:biliverdin-producing heme oxygenase [Corallococcus carmarthensis]NOK16047.1 biliverdin-producing heme oxygenase [Corallococcus carmarthensis]RKH05176.1 heme oxygenase [Corallococcus carmarthensis]
MALLQRLKTETRPHHERTEGVVRLMDARLTPQDYQRHLEAFHGLYLPLEALLAGPLSALEPALKLEARWKTPLLEEDLRAMGHDTASLARLPRASPLPSLPGLAEALGCAYVLEGSTLGGQLILRHLTRHFGPDARVGTFAFFRAYGEQVGPMWRAFGAAVTQASERAASESFDAAVVQGARDTFDTFAAWLMREHDVPVRL